MDELLQSDTEKITFNPELVGCTLTDLYTLANKLLHNEQTSFEIARVQYGAKELVLYLMHNHKFITQITNIDNTTRLKGEPTKCYSIARSLMQNLANDSSQPLTYSFVSENPQMVKWAINKGTSVFNWAKFNHITQRNLLIAEEIIQPM